MKFKFTINSMDLNHYNCQYYQADPLLEVIFLYGNDYIAYKIRNVLNVYKH